MEGLLSMGPTPSNFSLKVTFVPLSQNGNLSKLKLRLDELFRKVEVARGIYSIKRTTLYSL